MLEGKRILLIVSGGIAAYKGPDLVRRLRQRGATVRCVLTAGSAEFVTALTLGAVSEDKVFQDLFSLTDEEEMGHIRLSREADLVLVAPATANILAKMAAGIADDLATTALMATDKPILVAPAMNVRMWENPATQENLATLEKRGIVFIGPEEGDMACGEWGLGRMSEPVHIVAALENFFRRGLALDGTRSLVTSGPTFEAIDPVRYLANRSSGKQGHAIAGALAASAFRAFEAIALIELLVARVNDAALSAGAMVKDGLREVLLRNADALTLLHVLNGTAVDRIVDGLTNVRAIAAQKPLPVHCTFSLVIEAAVNDVAHSFLPTSPTATKVPRLRRTSSPSVRASSGALQRRYCAFLTRRYHSDSRRTCFSV